MARHDRCNAIGMSCIESAGSAKWRECEGFASGRVWPQIPLDLRSLPEKVRIRSTTCAKNRSRSSDICLLVVVQWRGAGDRSKN
jgi:hypothetical protein